MNFFGSFYKVSPIILNNSLSSSYSYLLGSGNYLVLSYVFSHSNPFKIIIVASPPSSTIVVGPLPSGHVKALRVHSQYSLNVSPFHANETADFASAIAAAA